MVGRAMLVIVCFLCLMLLTAVTSPALAQEHVLLGAAGQAVGAMIDELRLGEEGDIMPYVTVLEFIVATAGEGLDVDDPAIRDDAASILPGVLIRLSDALSAHEELWKTGGTRQAEVVAATILIGETAVPAVSKAVADPAASVKLAGVTAAGKLLGLLEQVGAGGESAASLDQAVREILSQVMVDGDTAVSQEAAAGLQRGISSQQLTDDELVAQKDVYEGKLHDFLNEPMGGFYSSDIREFEHYHSNEAFREYVDHLFALGYGIEQAEGYYYLYVGEPVNYRDGEMD